MNWGWKIAIVYTTFVVMVMSMVIMASMKNVSLVEKDYYEKEIKYQDHIDKLKNTQALKDQFSAYYDNNNQQFKIHYNGYNGDPLDGEIRFFRPSDNRLDVKHRLSLNNNGDQVIELAGLKKGYWVANLSWQFNDVKYFKRVNLEIQ